MSNKKYDEFIIPLYNPSRRTSITSDVLIQASRHLDKVLAIETF